MLLRRVEEIVQLTCPQRFERFVMTIEGIDPVEQRLDQALTKLRDLERSLQTLTRRVAVLESSSPGIDETDSASVEPVFAEDESVWSWVGQSRVLPRVAMVSFALVVALVLRTLTDSRIIALELGVLLGVAYSALLVGLGWRLLARERRGRRVLPVCGVLLLCSVVLEAHGPFGLLTAAAANWILFGALIVMAAVSLRYRAGSILAFSVVSTSISALAIGFPHPDFPHTAGVVLAGNVVAFLGLRVGRVQWLAWVTFGLALFMWLVWSFQANAYLRQPEEPVPGLHVELFLPILATFALVFAALATIRAVRSPDATDAFHAFAPTANVLWAYAAGLAIVVPQGSTGTLAVVACAVSFAHFGVAAWLWRRIRHCSSAITSFAIAGTVLFAVSTPTLLDSFGLALPLWSALALGLIVLSSVCGSTGLRLSSYGLQVLVCALAITTDLFAAPPDVFGVSIGAAAVIMVLSAIHFRFARSHPPRAEAWTTRFDPKDRTAIVLFWVAAISGFGVLRLLAHQAIAGLGTDVENMFLCTQSVIVNCASIVLMLWGIRARNGEVLATAVLVAAFGGLRVVGSDLLSGHGIPLVMSVASFGAAAAIGSIVLGKWLGQRAPDTAA